MAEHVHYVPSMSDNVQLWAGLLLGPAAFALDEGLSYSLTQHACSTGHFYVLHVVTVFCAIIAASGVVIARKQMARFSDGHTSGGSKVDRSWFMARTGFWFSLGLFLTIVAMAVPKVILSPCD